MSRFTPAHAPSRRTLRTPHAVPAALPAVLAGAGGRAEGGAGRGLRRAHCLGRRPHVGAAFFPEGLNVLTCIFGLCAAACAAPRAAAACGCTFLLCGFEGLSARSSFGVVCLLIASGGGHIWVGPLASAACWRWGRWRLDVGASLPLLLVCSLPCRRSHEQTAPSHPPVLRYELHAARAVLCRCVTMDRYEVHAGWARSLEGLNLLCWRSAAQAAARKKPRSLRRVLSLGHIPFASE